MSTGPQIRLGTRMLVYCAVWLVAVVAFQVFLRPEGATESDLSALQQRLLWPLYAPFMVIVGLMQAATGSTRFPDWIGWAVVTGFAGHFAVTLTQSRRAAFGALVGGQILVLGVGVIFFVRQSYWPTGG